ncbi:FbpB family small basic protein [Ectobacillus panaciterrae]|uniref:FbpB family small basic protein n=1 Tax=Ectobacillus panaciterrae TaxID=363872 RepID=UPI00041250A4|nr:FbpB family small basic protein [Ectobacillus panaciterrae]
MRKMKSSLKGLTEKFKQEIMKDKLELEKIERRLEERHENRTKHMGRASLNRA